MRRASLLLAALLLGGCMALRPQNGGRSTASLGGATAPTVVTTAAPENPQTPTNTTIEKSTTRTYELPTTTAAAAADTQGDSARDQPETSPRSAAAQSESRVGGVPAAGASPAVQTHVRGPGAAAPGAILRETVTERVTTQTGVAQKDTARELGARLANLRGVMWVGILLLIGGPLVGWRLGWFTNGCIAGGVGLLLIILAAIIPGHEAWFGLVGLGLLPLVGYVYYRARHDAATAAPAAATPAPPAVAAAAAVPPPAAATPPQS